MLLRMLEKFSLYADIFTEKLAGFVNWLVLLMIITAVYNAFGRYAGKLIGVNLSSNFFLEIQWYLFSLVFLLGASSALAKNAHVRVDVFSSKFSSKTRAKIDFAGGLVLLLPFCIFIIVISFPSVISSWSVFEQSPDPGGIVRYPIKTVLPAAFIILFLQGISEMIKAWFLMKGIRAENLPDDSVKRGVV